MTLRCKLFGHKVNPMNFALCDRCDRELSYDEIVCNGMIPSALEWISGRLRWFKRCEDCGKRFGRHDDNQPHVPF